MTTAPLSGSSNTPQQLPEIQATKSKEADGLDKLFDAAVKVAKFQSEPEQRGSVSQALQDLDNLLEQLTSKSKIGSRVQTPEKGAVNQSSGTQRANNIEGVASQALGRELGPPPSEPPPSPPQDIGPPPSELPPSPPQDLGPPPPIPPRPANYIPVQDRLNDDIKIPPRPNRAPPLSRAQVNLQTEAVEVKEQSGNAAGVDNKLKSPLMQKVARSPTPPTPPESRTLPLVNEPAKSPVQSENKEKTTQQDKDLSFKAWRLFSKVMPRQLVKVATTLLIHPKDLANKEYDPGLLKQLPAKMISAIPAKKLSESAEHILPHLSTDQARSLSNEQLEVLVFSNQIQNLSPAERQNLTNDQLKTISRAFIQSSNLVTSLEKGTTTYQFNSATLAFFDPIIDNTGDVRKQVARAIVNEKYPTHPPHEFSVTVKDGISNNDLPQRLKDFKPSGNQKLSIDKNPFPRGDGGYLQNGADTQLAGLYQGPKLALDEKFAEEHPDIRRVAYMFRTANLDNNNQTENLQYVRTGGRLDQRGFPGSGVSKGMVFSGIQQLSEIANRAYGDNFENLDEAGVRANVTVLDRPNTANIVYTVAPNTQLDEHKLISQEQVRDLFSTLLSNYSAVKDSHAGSEAPVIHGGHLGTGAFQNSVGLNFLLQMAAAHMTNVDLQLHDFPSKPARVQEAQRVFEDGFVSITRNGRGEELSREEIPPLKQLLNEGNWDAVETAIFKAIAQFQWANQKDNKAAAGN